jgi:hypothetical protein
MTNSALKWPPSKAGGLPDTKAAKRRRHQLTNVATIDVRRPARVAHNISILGRYFAEFCNDFFRNRVTQTAQRRPIELSSRGGRHVDVVI